MQPSVLTQSIKQQLLD